eukprot:1639876-Amphidinium_carterae.1
MQCEASSFLVSCTAAWCRAQTKDWYASSPPLMYLPTTPMISGLDASKLDNHSCVHNLTVTNEAVLQSPRA